MFLHDAEQRTKSWQLRHSTEAIRTLGVWRWKGIDEHREEILAACIGKRVIDLGGADGPLGLGSIVVDVMDIEHQRLEDVAGTVDVIFTSHTLEHCENIESMLADMAEKLDRRGTILVHVPAWTCRRWRANGYANPKQSKHLWTFALGSDAAKCPEETMLIDLVMAKWFKVEIAEYCGDNSIFIIGSKRDSPNT